MRGPWGAMILCKAKYAADIDKSVFPGSQGGPLNHAIAGKAVMLAQWKTPEFKSYAQAVVNNARVLAEGLSKRKLRLVSGGARQQPMLVRPPPPDPNPHKKPDTLPPV